MASDIFVNIGLGNCLTPVRQEAIIGTDADLLSIRPPRTYFIFYLKCKSFHPRKCVSNIVRESTDSRWILRTYDDVIKWKHFPRYWPFVRGIHRSPVNSPHKGQWRGALMFSLIFAWINRSVNNGEAGDLRRHRAHYDVTVMIEWPVISGKYDETPSYHKPINSLAPGRFEQNFR